MITPDQFIHRGEYIVLTSETPLKTFSSAMLNSGYGEFRYFINRTVDVSYNPHNATEEMRDFVQQEGFNTKETVAMMTAVDMKFAQFQYLEDGETSITFFVTLGLGNTVDVTKSFDNAYRPSVGTINIFVFINGIVTDEALIQALICAVETKTKVMHERGIIDYQTGTIATGTSTDSVLVAATQVGEFHAYGGSITRLGSLVGKGLYKTLNDAVEKYLQYKKHQH
ncbi:hypothetical protein MTP04_13950 [Lysinibacillus sp. PLM2]|nr:hypothetical protein MTP04_13950 [Lysinibacillus sp. PLM2]